MTSGLELSQVTVIYPGGVCAVDQVCLNVAPGQIVALQGPSGCGKSSLLRAVAGFEELAQGTISWNGQEVVRVPVHKRGFGFMFQDGQLFPFRNVGGNVAYGLKGWARADKTRRVKQMLELVGLPNYARREIATLSGGQAQRVALARALAPRPRLLLLDEPLSALDQDLRARLAQDLRRIITAQGTTSLYVTHDREEAVTVADRICYMRAGKLTPAAGA